MSLVSVLGCGIWFFPIEEQLYWFDRDRDGPAKPHAGHQCLLSRCCSYPIRLCRCLLQYSPSADAVHMFSRDGSAGGGNKEKRNRRATPEAPGLLRSGLSPDRGNRANIKPYPVSGLLPGGGGQCL